MALLDKSSINLNDITLPGIKSVVYDLKRSVESSDEKI